MNIPNITGIESLFVWTNTLTGGLFGVFLPVSIFLVIFLNLVWSSNENALLVALFMTTVLSMFLSLLTITPVNVVVVFSILTSVAALVRVLSGKV